MTLTFWWVLVLVLGIVIGNLWLLRTNKAQDEKWRQHQAQRDKNQDGATTGTALTSAVTPVASQKKTDASPTETDSAGSDQGGSGTD
ncbi:DUF2897 family protein [Rheinheimera sp.]|uniref:DUF2897 family protein n=1 Tax=Rheinheimera sp. TaxID=1869214 RepID=UPI00307E553D